MKPGKFFLALILLEFLLLSCTTGQAVKWDTLSPRTQEEILEQGSAELEITNLPGNLFAFKKISPEYKFSGEIYQISSTVFYPDNKILRENGEQKFRLIIQNPKIVLSINYQYSQGELISRTTSIDHIPENFSLIWNDQPGLLPYTVFKGTVDSIPIEILIHKESSKLLSTPLSGADNSKIKDPLLALSDNEQFFEIKSEDETLGELINSHFRLTKSSRILSPESMKNLIALVEGTQVFTRTLVRFKEEESLSRQFGSDKFPTLPRLRE